MEKSPNGEREGESGSKDESAPGSGDEKEGLYDSDTDGDGRGVGYDVGSGATFGTS